MCMCMLPVCMFVYPMPAVPVKMRALNPLSMEFQMVANHHVGMGNQTQYCAIETVLITPGPSLQSQCCFPFM